MALRTPSRSEDETSFGAPEDRPPNSAAKVPAEQLERIPTATQQDIDDARSGHTFDNDQPRYKPSDSTGVYDDQQRTTTGEASGPQGVYAKMGGRELPKGQSGANSFTPRQLANQEAAGGSGAQSAVNGKEAQLGNTAPTKTITFRNEGMGRAGKLALSLKINSKKKITGLVVTGVLGVGGVGIFSVAQGPLQAIHLAQILQKPFAGQEETSAIRVQGIYRFYRTGNIGETRLSFFGSKINAKVLRDLEKNGFKFTLDKNTGQILKMEVDTGKTNAFKDALTPEEQRTAIAKELGVSEDKVKFQRRGTGGGAARVWTIDDAKGSDVGIKRGFLKDSLGLSGKGRVYVAFHIRPVARFLNAPSVLHPIKKLEAIAIQKASGKKTARDNAKRQAEIERKDAQRIKNASAIEPSEAAKSRLSSVKDKLKGGRAGTAAALGFTGTLCLAKEIAGSVADLNRDNGPVQASKAAFLALGHGAQIKSGDDFTLGQLGEYVKGFTDDNGETIWKSKPLNELAGKKDVGKDIDPAIKQTFSPNSKAAVIEKELDDAGADIICSTGGLIIQGVVGVALIATGGGGVAGLAIRGGSAAIGAGVLIAVLEFLPRILADEPLIGNVLEGPLGGGIAAYGAREGAGIIGRSTGGIALKPAESTRLEVERELREKEEYNQKNFASRMFDLKDYRSLASVTIRSQSTSLTKNIINSIASVLNMRTWLNGFASYFTPKILAAEAPYDWGFPEYGFSRAILDDPKYQDPYNNADIAASLLDSPVGEDYITRSMKCFGAKISKESGRWSVTSEKDVNPAGKDYLESNCADDIDESWTRIRLFIFDSKTITAYVCSEFPDNDPDAQEACEELGLGTSQTSTTPAQPTDDSSTGGIGDYAGLTRDELVSKILSNPNWSPQSENPVNDIKNGVAKDKLLSLILGIVEQVNVKIRPSVIKTGHDDCTARGTTSNHFSGTAIDLGDAGSTRADMVKVYNWLYTNREQLEINELIWDPIPPGTTNLRAGVARGYDAATLQGHRNHIHVSVKGERLLAGCPRD